MPEIAKSVVVDYTKGKVTVDGAEFPWCIAEKGAKVVAVPNDLPMVTLTIFADHVEVVGP